MQKQDRDLVLDFLTLAVAVFAQSLLISAFATMTKPSEITDKVFKESFGYSMFSIGISYLLFHTIKYLLTFKISLPDWSSGALWSPTIISGTFLLTYLAFDSLFFGHFEPYFGFLMAALIPALMFRLPVIFAISFWKERKRKGTPISYIR